MASCIEKNVDYEKLYKSALEEIQNLKDNLKINKQILEEMSTMELKLEQKQKDEILILNQIISKNQLQSARDLKELEEEVEYLRNSLEEKEYDLQLKEHRWGQVEQYILEHAREDTKLQEKLNEIRFLWDDYTIDRKITTVVNENEDLKSQLDEVKTQLEQTKTQLSEVKSSLTSMDVADYSPCQNVYNEEPLTTKNKSPRKLSWSHPGWGDYKGFQTPSNMKIQVQPHQKLNLKTSRFSLSLNLENERLEQKYLQSNLQKEENLKEIRLKIPSVLPTEGTNNEESETSINLDEPTLFIDGRISIIDKEMDEDLGNCINSIKSG